MATSTSKVAEALRKVRETLATPERWTKGSMARDSTGRGVVEDDKDANCWCLGGAVWREFPLGYGGDEPTVALRTEAFNALRGAIADEFPEFPLVRTVGRRVCLPVFNDHAGTTHADVLRVVDRAIADAERGGGA